MKTMIRLATRSTLLLVTALLLTGATQAPAQIQANFQFNRGFPQQRVIVLPTYYTGFRVVPRRSRFFSNPTATENWLVRLKTPGGVTTRAYQVTDSRAAILKARREFPNASLVSVKKSYR